VVRGALKAGHASPGAPGRDGGRAPKEIAWRLAVERERALEPRRLRKTMGKKQRKRIKAKGG
jgi:hypothetical protein